VRRSCRTFHSTDVYNSRGAKAPGSSIVERASQATFTVAVIDQKTEEPPRSIQFTNRPRPLTFYTNPDGSTKWVLAGLSELHGFVVADFATGKEIYRIKFPDLGGPVKMQMVRAAAGNPNHGIGVQPDNKAVWITDRLYNVVHAYSLPDLTEVSRDGIDCSGSLLDDVYASQQVRLSGERRLGLRFRHRHADVERVGSHPRRPSSQEEPYGGAALMFHCRRKDPVIDEVVGGGAAVMSDLPVEQDRPFYQLIERLNGSDKQHLRSGCDFATCHDPVAHPNSIVAHISTLLL